MIWVIFSVVAVEGAAATWAFKWALPRSDRAFFAVFLGDAFVRLIGLGLFTGWLYLRHLPFATPLVAVAFGSLAVSLIQVPFLYKAD